MKMYLNYFEYKVTNLREVLNVAHLKSIRDE